MSKIEKKAAAPRYVVQEHFEHCIAADTRLQYHYAYKNKELYVALNVVKLFICAIITWNYFAISHWKSSVVHNFGCCYHKTEDLKVSQQLEMTIYTRQMHLLHTILIQIQQKLVVCIAYTSSSSG